MTKFFDLHVFYGRKDAFSVGIKIDTDKEDLTEEEVIEHSITDGLIEPEDSNHVDYVIEIDESEYKLLTF